MRFITNNNENLKWKENTAGYRLLTFAEYFFFENNTQYRS
jgi:hypothetical protein